MAECQMGPSALRAAAEINIFQAPEHVTVNAELGQEPNLYGEFLLFSFCHPRPFSRKEVVVMMTRAKVRPAVTPGTMLVVDADPTTPGMPEALGGREPVDAPKVTFTVSYTLSEYLGILANHVCAHISSTAKRPPTRVSRWIVYASLAVLGPPLFFFKRRAMPTLSFTFDASGIERVSAAGTQRHPWCEVKAVKRYTKGYLLLFADQGMPIPHRCLNANQSSVLRAFFKNNGLA